MGRGLALAVGLPVRERRGVAVGERERVSSGEREAVPVRVVDREGREVRESVGVSVAEALRRALPLPLGLRLALREAAREGVAVGDSVDVAERRALAVSVARERTLALAPGDALALRVAVEVRVEEAERLAVRVEEAESVGSAPMSTMPREQCGRKTRARRRSRAVAMLFVTLIAAAKAPHCQWRCGPPPRILQAKKLVPPLWRGLHHGHTALLAGENVAEQALVPQLHLCARAAPCQQLQPLECSGANALCREGLWRCHRGGQRGGFNVAACALYKP